MKLPAMSIPSSLFMPSIVLVMVLTALVLWRTRHRRAHWTKQDGFNWAVVCWMFSITVLVLFR